LPRSGEGFSKTPLSDVWKFSVELVVREILEKPSPDLGKRSLFVFWTWCSCRDLINGLFLCLYKLSEVRLSKEYFCAHEHSRCTWMYKCRESHGWLRTTIWHRKFDRNGGSTCARRTLRLVYSQLQFYRALTRCLDTRCCICKRCEY